MNMSFIRSMSAWRQRDCKNRRDKQNNMKFYKVRQSFLMNMSFIRSMSAWRQRDCKNRRENKTNMKSYKVRKSFLMNMSLIRSLSAWRQRDCKNRRAKKLIWNLIQNLVTLIAIEKGFAQVFLAVAAECLWRSILLTLIRCYIVQKQVLNIWSLCEHLIFVWAPEDLLVNTCTI